MGGVVISLFVLYGRPLFYQIHFHLFYDFRNTTTNAGRVYHVIAVWGQICFNSIAVCCTDLVFVCLTMSKKVKMPFHFLFPLLNTIKCNIIPFSNNVIPLNNTIWNEFKYTPYNIHNAHPAQSTVRHAGAVRHWRYVCLHRPGIVPSHGANIAPVCVHLLS